MVFEISKDGKYIYINYSTYLIKSNNYAASDSWDIVPFPNGQANNAKNINVP